MHANTAQVIPVVNYVLEVSCFQSHCLECVGLVGFGVVVVVVVVVDGIGIVVEVVVGLDTGCSIVVVALVDKLGEMAWVDMVVESMENKVVKAGIGFVGMGSWEKVGDFAVGSTVAV